MQDMRPDAPRDAGLRRLGAERRLKEIAYDEFGQPRPFEERVRRLEAYKAELKLEVRQLARTMHPDLTHDLSDAERAGKAGELAEINAARAFIDKLSVRPPQVLRPSGVVVCIYAGSGVSFSGTGSPTTTFRWR